MHILVLKIGAINIRNFVPVSNEKYILIFFPLYFFILQLSIRISLLCLKKRVLWTIYLFIFSFQLCLFLFFYSCCGIVPSIQKPIRPLLNDMVTWVTSSPNQPLFRDVSWWHFLLLGVACHFFFFYTEQLFNVRLKSHSTTWAHI